jgi:hypothetical protein
MLATLDPVERMQAAEREMLPLLPDAAATSIDRQIIRDGIALGIVPSVLRTRPDMPADIDIRWLRFRAACARAEMRLYPEMTAYLRAVANGADAEATAREKAYTP